MKRAAMVLALVLIIAGGLFAQEQWGGKKNFVSADLGIVVGGVRYERIILPKVSVGADFYWANSFIIFNELEAGVFGRYYLLKGLFGELGLGFHTHTGVEDLESKDAAGDTHTTSDLVLTTGFGITPAIGWKFDPGKDGGFFLEPVVRVPITVGEKTSGWGYYESETGASVGFVLSLGLGWAF